MNPDDNVTYGVYLKIETRKLHALKAMRSIYRDATDEELPLSLAARLIDAVREHQDIVRTDPKTLAVDL